MKIGDKVQLETGEDDVTRKVYDQSLKKTVFYAGEVRLTGSEKLVEEKEENIIVKKLDSVEEAIKAIPRVEIPEYPKFPEPKDFPAFPEFPKSMMVNVPDLSSIEKKLDTIIEKEDNETKELIKNALEELKKTKSDVGVVSAINKLAGIIPKSQDYTDILKEISKKLNPIVQEELRINKEQWKQLTKALSSIGGFGGGPGAVQLRSENGTILNPATEEKQDEIIASLGGGVRIKKIDEALPYTYIGEAAVGTATSAASWRVKRIDDTNDPDSTILYAGTGVFDQVWDNRASLTYN